jgi:hypothetical protein
LHGRSTSKKLLLFQKRGLSKCFPHLE